MKGGDLVVDVTVENMHMKNDDSHNMFFVDMFVGEYGISPLKWLKQLTKKRYSMKWRW